MIRILSLFLVFTAFIGPALRAKGELVFSHFGDTDPTTEGWALSLAGVGNSVGPVTDDLGTGTNSWFTNDDDAFTGSNIAAYVASPSAAQITEGNLRGWTLSTNLRVVDIPDDIDASVIVLYRDGVTSWEMNFGSEADGDTVIQLTGGPQFTLENSGTGYHQFDLVYDPASSTADLLVDGLEVISDHDGFSLATAPSIAWGSGSTAGTGQGNFASVSFAIIPEPSCFIAFANGGVAIVWRRRRKRLDN